MLGLLDAIVGKLEMVKGPDAKGWYTALCPFHPDKNHPNLRLTQNGFKCMACGEGGNIKKLAVKLGLEMESKRKRQIIDTYDYKDETGTLLYQVVRYDPKDFRQRKPDGHGGWIWDLKGVKRVLYCLPELLASHKEAIVYITEGEKDVKALQSLGLIATCNSGGAGKFTEDLRAPLKDRNVVIIADKDDPGRRHAQQVAAILYGFSATVKILEMPDEVH